MAVPQKKADATATALKKVLQKGLDMKKLSGKLSWSGDPVALQRKMRANDR